MKFSARIISPLEKVFYDDKLSTFPKYAASSALLGEKHSLSVAYRLEDTTESAYFDGGIFVKLTGDAAKGASAYTVEHVPAVFACPAYEKPDRYLRGAPGLYPDALKPIDEKTSLVPVQNITHSLWIELDTDKLLSGDHTLIVSFYNAKGEELAKEKHTVHVIDAVLPEQKLMVTQWFHTDCLADFYKVKVFSRDHWKAIESFIRLYVELGNNMLYTPLFTPPLDTAVGGERTTVQTVDVTYDGNEYRFGFDKLRKFIRLAKDCGVRYFEMSHIFTQWGAYHAPKIMAKVGGRTKKIFGWETSSHSLEYEAFLAAFLPALRTVLTEEGIAKCTYFHISDEPSLQHLESYRTCSKILRKYLPDFPIMDAMSNVEFCDEGLLDTPVPFLAHVKPFFERNPRPRFTYYCGANANIMGRALGMPSCRNRISGDLFYIHDVDGFLHWGYNFYNTCRSTEHIDPFAVTDAGKLFCAGDSFIVYPGNNFTALPSIRAFVFRDGLQDMRALVLCEKLCGKDAVLNILKDANGGVLPALTEVPQDDYYTQKVREAVNSAIEAALKK